jgi:hypothetical protein
MLVRVLSVHALAKAMTNKGEKSPGRLNAQLIEQLMIWEWHGALRHKWHMLEGYRPTTVKGGNVTPP